MFFSLYYPSLAHTLLYPFSLSLLHTPAPSLFFFQLIVFVLIVLQVREDNQQSCEGELCAKVRLSSR